MNRRSFLGMSAAGLASLFLPKLEIGETMQLGSVLVKIATNKNLSQEELDFLRLEGNSTQLRNAFVAGNTTPQSTLKVDFPFNLIFSETLAVASATMANIQIPPKFPMLMIIGSARSDIAQDWEAIRLQINGDAGTNYDTGAQGEQDGVSGPTQSLGQTGATIGTAAGALAPAGSAGGFWAFTTNVNSSMWKSIFGVTGARGTTYETVQWTFHNSWKSVSAIESISILLGDGGNFVAGSRVSVYGLF